MRLFFRLLDRISTVIGRLLLQLTLRYRRIRIVMTAHRQMMKTELRDADGSAGDHTTHSHLVCFLTCPACLPHAHVWSKRRATMKVICVGAGTSLCSE